MEAPARRFWIEVSRATALLLLVGLAWCAVQNRLKGANWRVPLFVESDGLSLLAAEKSALEGHFSLLLPKTHPFLGAPNVANLNDYPITEELLIIGGGLLARLVGLFPASNLLVLLAHLLAALSFYIVCRVLRYSWVWSFVGSVAFACSHYAFQRGFPHLALTYYWHIPLCLLVCAWAASRRGLRINDPRCWIAFAVAAVTGMQNPYYTNIFLQFLGFAVLGQLFRRRWKNLLAPVLAATVAGGAFLLMNLDTLSYQVKHGKNREAAGRTYQGMELYALKPLDLIMPPPDHRSAIARKLAWDYTYDEAKKVYLRGESFSPYLGLVGIGALLWLGGLSTACAWRFPRRAIPPAGGLIAWLLLYSVIGGINGFLGQVGINLFRCTNRYSIYILAIALLFAVGKLSRLNRKWDSRLSLGLAAGVIALIFWDQLPPRTTQSSINQVRATLSSDHSFTVQLEGMLPENAMIFQLPAMRFPESWPIGQMGDYEHFRPYLFSHHLRFSYGDDKGRGREDWQFQIERLLPADMLTQLERIGFAALYINRKGYPDRAAALVQSLQAQRNCVIVESPKHDLVAVLLQPAAIPEIPERPPEFRTGWYDQEGTPGVDTWHYSKGNAELVLYNNSSAPRAASLHFELASPSPRTVVIWREEELLYRSPALTSGRTSVSLPLQLGPGATVLEFKTEPPVIFPGNPDKRLLGFLLYNLTVTPGAGDL